MLTSYKLYWKNYANFRGRTPRSGYWWVFLWNVVISAFFTLLAFVVSAGIVTSLLSNLSGGNTDPGTIIGGIMRGGVAIIIIAIISLIYAVATIIPGLSLGVRRLHDTGRRLYWILINYLAPILLILFMLIGAFTRSPGAIVVL